MTGKSFLEALDKSVFGKRFPELCQKWRNEFGNILIGRENIEMGGFSSLSEFRDRESFVFFLSSAEESEIEEKLKEIRTDLKTALRTSSKRGGGSGRGRKLRTNPLFWALVGLFVIMLGFGIAAIFIPEDAIADKLPLWAWNMIKFCFSPVGAGGCILQLALALREWRSDMNEGGKDENKPENTGGGNNIVIKNNKVKIVNKEVHNSAATILVAVAVVAIVLIAVVLAAFIL